jgi:D-alanine-D-alanine ligase
MKVGITYDLQEDYLARGFSEEQAAEFDRPDTIDGIEGALWGLGYETDRIGHIENLVRRLSRGERWDMVFNIAEGVKGFGREAQVPALLDAYNIPYTFSDPLVLSVTLHKAVAKHVLRDKEIPTPDFFTVEHLSDLDQVDLAYPIFAKPVAEGTGKGISAASKIKSRDEMVSVCERLLALHGQPVLLEAFLPGREFTVGITGTGERAAAIGALEVLLQEEAEPEIYSYLNKKKFETRVKYCLVEDTEAQRAIAVALDAWRCLGCRDGGRVDLRSDGYANPNFLEVNPLAGLNPEISDLPILCTMAGKSYQELIGQIMESALERSNLGLFPETSFCPDARHSA